MNLLCKKDEKVKSPIKEKIARKRKGQNGNESTIFLVCHLVHITYMIVFTDIRSQIHQF